MTGQVFDRVLSAIRIGDPNGAHPIFSAKGAELYPGRWNTKASPMIYASEHYSTAMLEKLVHGNGHLPPNQHYVVITIPPGVSYELPNLPNLGGWDAAVPGVSQQFGEQWYVERRTAVLIVPNVVARMENNILINPMHDEFTRISTSIHTPVWWDSRLFSAGHP